MLPVTGRATGLHEKKGGTLSRPPAAKFLFRKKIIKVNSHSIGSPVVKRFPNRIVYFVICANAFEPNNFQTFCRGKKPRLNNFKDEALNINFFPAFKISRFNFNVFNHTNSMKKFA